MFIHNTKWITITNIESFKKSRFRVSKRNRNKNKQYLKPGRRVVLEPRRLIGVPETALRYNAPTRSRRYFRLRLLVDQIHELIPFGLHPVGIPDPENQPRLRIFTLGCGKLRQPQASVGVGHRLGRADLPEPADDHVALRLRLVALLLLQRLHLYRLFVLDAVPLFREHFEFSKVGLRPDCCRIAGYVRRVYAACLSVNARVTNSNERRIQTRHVLTVRKTVSDWAHGRLAVRAPSA